MADLSGHERLLRGRPPRTAAHLSGGSFRRQRRAAVGRVVTQVLRFPGPKPVVERRLLGSGHSRARGLDPLPPFDVLRSCPTAQPRLNEVRGHEAATRGHRDSAACEVVNSQGDKSLTRIHTERADWYHRSSPSMRTRFVVLAGWLRSCRRRMPAGKQVAATSLGVNPSPGRASCILAFGGTSRGAASHAID